MKWMSVLLLLAAFAFSVGCADILQKKRIRLHREKFDSYSQQEKAYILEKRVVEGMAAEQVYMARGVPDVMERIKGSPKIEEKWIYSSPPDEKLVVEFQQGRVTKVYGDRQ